MSISGNHWENIYTEDKNINMRPIDLSILNKSHATQPDTCTKENKVKTHGG